MVTRIVLTGRVGLCVEVNPLAASGKGFTSTGSVRAQAGKAMILPIDGLSCSLRYASTSCAGIGRAKW